MPSQQSWTNTMWLPINDHHILNRKIVISSTIHSIQFFNTLQETLNTRSWILSYQKKSFFQRHKSLNHQLFRPHHIRLVSVPSLNYFDAMMLHRPSDLCLKFQVSMKISLAYVIVAICRLPVFLLSSDHYLRNSYWRTPEHTFLLTYT